VSLYNQFRGLDCQKEVAFPSLHEIFFGLNFIAVIVRYITPGLKNEEIQSGLTSLVTLRNTTLLRHQIPFRLIRIQISTLEF
jgi:hypothetical protein